MSSFHPTLALDELQFEFHNYAKERGFWTHSDVLADRVAGEYGSRDAELAELRHCIDSEKIALMHSELSEALSALRDGDMDEVEMELADTVIRILDYAEHRGLRISRGINRAREKNRKREYRHGRQW